MEVLLRNMVLSFVAGISLLIASSIQANTEIENKLGIRFYGSFFYSEKVGVALRQEATGSQRAMLRCLSDVLLRLPREWTAEPIGPNAEAELLEWYAEKYRQALAALQ